MYEFYFYPLLYGHFHFFFFFNSFFYYYYVLVLKLSQSLNLNSCHSSGRDVKTSTWPGCILFRLGQKLYETDLLRSVLEQLRDGRQPVRWSGSGWS